MNQTPATSDERVCKCGGFLPSSEHERLGKRTGASGPAGSAPPQARTHANFMGRDGSEGIPHNLPAYWEETGGQLSAVYGNIQRWSGLGRSFYSQIRPD